MSRQMAANKVINGSWGRLWWDGDLLANTKSFEAKVTLNYAVSYTHLRIDPVDATIDAWDIWFRQRGDSYNVNAEVDDFLALAERLKGGK